MVEILFAGDFCPNKELQNQINSGDLHDIFGEYLPIIQNSDYAVVNFETSVKPDGAKPIEKCGVHLSCSAKSIEFLNSAGFGLLTLANNHFYDYGDQGVAETLKACQKVGIDSVGGGVDIYNASRIFHQIIKNKRFAFINVCEHEFSIATENKGGSNPLNPVQQFYSIKEACSIADYVIVIVHGGHEHYQLPSPRMKETYRFFIDAGADLVINHHQHCFSGYELYKGKLIFYGLGNFLFDSPYKEDNNFWEGYLVKVRFLESNLEYTLIPYYQCKGKIGLSSLHGEELDSFNRKINELNEIIINDQNLSTAFEERLGQTKKTYLMTFEPSRPLFLMKLIKKIGLGNIFISKEGQKFLYNRIACESHRDSIIQILINEIR